MNDAFLMRGLNRFADRNEQFQSLTGRQPLAIAESRHWSARHQLHHKVRLIVLGGASIKNGGDVGVIHECEGLPFLLETGNNASRRHPSLDDFDDFDDFDGNGPTNGRCLLRSPHCAHAAFAQLLQQPIGTNPSLPGCGTVTVIAGLVRQSGDKCLLINTSIRWRND